MNTNFLFVVVMVSWIFSLFIAYEAGTAHGFQEAYDMCWAAIQRSLNELKGRVESLDNSLEDSDEDVDLQVTTGTRSKESIEKMGLDFSKAPSRRRS